MTAGDLLLCDDRRFLLVGTATDPRSASQNSVCGPVTGKGKASILHIRNLIQNVRGSQKTPGFTAAAVLALAVGVESTSSILSLLDAGMLWPLPFRDADVWR
jgi:hypothetical protein